MTKRTRSCDARWMVKQVDLKKKKKKAQKSIILSAFARTCLACQLIGKKRILHGSKLVIQ